MEGQKNIHFRKAILGFESVTEFVLSDASEKQENPFKLLTNDDNALSFILLDPKMFDESYNPVIDKELLVLLEAENDADLESYGIVVIPEDIKKMTINLRSPIIINKRNGNAMQLVLNDEKYSIRHKILNY